MIPKNLLSTAPYSELGWPWRRLRKKSLGVYESYADMIEYDWIHMTIVVQGTKAALP